MNSTYTITGPTGGTDATLPPRFINCAPGCGGVDPDKNTMNQPNQAGQMQISYSCYFF